MVVKDRFPLLSRSVGHDGKIAILDDKGAHNYNDLIRAAKKLSRALLKTRDDLQEARVVFMVPPCFDYPVVQFGIWQAGGVAVPLSISDTNREIEYVIRDVNPELVLCHPTFEERLRPLSDQLDICLLSTSGIQNTFTGSFPQIDAGRRAMILYTSGTTGSPKGVVLTHENIEAQVTSLVDAWQWSREDFILSVLPLHHTHGIINVLLCALWTGATCEMMPHFDEEAVWSRFLKGGVSLFMAVPTIYAKLLSFWERSHPRKQKLMTQACKNFRLMVSGSAALPVSLFEKWKIISGQILLERYGMTEIGMALSNPLKGNRRPGFVGTALSKIQMRLADDLNVEVTREGEPGELQVKGKHVFLEYWGQEMATKKAFKQGWFCTGDMAVIESGSYRILGRQSVDIIKTGGHKISALEVEGVLIRHPAIRECAVVGIEDCEWGERVCAVLVLEAGYVLSLKDLREWGRAQLAAHKLPSRANFLDKLPRNSMGKLNKPRIKNLIGGK